MGSMTQAAARGRIRKFKNQIDLPQTGHWNIKQVQHAKDG
jgi:hypothetical protein